MKKVRMFEVVFAISVAVVVFACVGCCSTPPCDRRVTIAPALCGDAWVSDVRLTRGASSHLTMQANVVNETDDDLRMEYRVDWFDSTGTALPSVLSTWQAASAAPREMLPIQAVAPSPDAIDFRLYIQPQRR